MDIGKYQLSALFKHILEKKNFKKTKHAVGVFKKVFPNITNGLSDDEIFFMGSNIDKFTKKGEIKLQKLDAYIDQNGNRKVIIQNNNGEIRELKFGKAIDKESSKTSQENISVFGDKYRRASGVDMKNVNDDKNIQNINAILKTDSKGNKWILKSYKNSSYDVEM